MVSIESGKWQPTGMPGIAKLFEGLNGRVPFEVVLIDKSGRYPHSSQIKVNFDEIDATFHVFTSFQSYSWFTRNPILNKLRRLVDAILHFRRLYSIIKESNVNLLYADRENVVTGALLAVLLKKEVILRIHGVNVFYDRFSDFFLRLRYPIRYLSFKAPFKYIICSEDGTPGKEFLSRFTSTQVPKSILLNGVEKSARALIDVRTKYQIPESVPIILFVGRLEGGKGVEIFIQSLKKLNRINPNFYAIVVGGGQLYNSLRLQTKGYGNFIFTNSMKHDDVHSFYKAADIYVSLNSLGNLSNTVLEALQEGNCIVTYGGDRYSRRDQSTEKYLKDAAIFIDRYKVLDELPNKLNELLCSPGKRRQMKNKAKKQANKILKTWDQRINEEIGIIKSVISRDPSINLST